MPNWVVNKVEFSGEQENINKVLDAIKGDDRLFDFEKLIPMPENIFRGPVGPDERKLYGTNNWYDWCCTRWGTKWNACDEYMETEDVLVFNTAWSCPMPVLDKLAELCYKHDVEFTGKWADEDTGFNTGIFECDNYGDEYWFGFECMPNESHEAYEIFTELYGENSCLGQDDNGKWIHYNCDTCPNKGYC